MARLIYTRRAFADLDRLTELLLDANPAAARETAALISEAIDILANHRLIGVSAYRLIGRPAENALRGLVISYGPTGYLALHSDEEFDDVARLLTARPVRPGHFST